MPKQYHPIQTKIDFNEKAEGYTPAKHPELVFTVRRDARIDLKHEAGKYTKFAGKIAVKGLKKALAGISYGLSDMIEQAERQRAYKAEKAKQGIEVRYTFF